MELTLREQAMKKSNVKPIPEGYHTLTSHLTVRDAARVIEFYKEAFGAESALACSCRTAS